MSAETSQPCLICGLWTRVDDGARFHLDGEGVCPDCTNGPPADQVDARKRRKVLWEARIDRLEDLLEAGGAERVVMWELATAGLVELRYTPPGPPTSWADLLRDWASSWTRWVTRRPHQVGVELTEVGRRALISRGWQP